MKIDDMPAGREMDGAIHHHLFDPTFNPAMHKIRDDEKHRHYSTEIAAAWAVLTGFVGSSIGQRNGTYECYIDGFPNSLTFAETASLAICRAALKAMGVTEI